MFKKVQRIEFSTVTTRSGDKGDSGTYSGERYRKDDTIFEAVGELDMLNSYIGLVKIEFDTMQDKKSRDFIDSIQTDIIALSGLVATHPFTKDGEEMYNSLRQIKEKDIHRLERFSKKLLDDTVIEPVFINPGKTRISALLDVARSQTRTAERRIVTMIRDKMRTDLYEVQKYVNRLSDVLFVMGRYWEQHPKNA